MSIVTIFGRHAPALALALAAATAGCTHGSSGSAGAAPSAAPVYPGAKTESAGASAVAETRSTAGSAFSTSDSFGTVYAWYKKNLPEGSEQAHVTSPQEAATFFIGQGTHRLSVSLAASPLCCRTIIVITAFPNG